MGGGILRLLLRRRDQEFARCIYALDRTRIAERRITPQNAQQKPDIELIDDPELIRFNRRAAMQRGVFMRCSTVNEPLPVVLQPALTKFQLPSKDKQSALGDLDAMLISETVLFSDLDAAARTAARRIIRSAP